MRPKITVERFSFVFEEVKKVAEKSRNIGNYYSKDFVCERESNNFFLFLCTARRSLVYTRGSRFIIIISISISIIFIII